MNERAESVLVKRCPKCRAERPATEIYCGGSYQDVPCSWQLLDVSVYQSGQEPIVRELVPASGDDVHEDPEEPKALSPERTCRNGHVVPDGDFICPTCNEVLGMQEAPQNGFDYGDLIGSAPGSSRDPLPADDDVTPLPVIENWRAIKHVTAVGEGRQSYLVRHEIDERSGFLTIFDAGSQPDSSVYNALQKMDIDHHPELFAFGRWQEQAYEVSEFIEYGSLTDWRVEAGDADRIRVMIDEIGRALDCFMRAGLRHRDLNPDVILIRDLERLDLVITGFGSARLSEFDLDVVSPLEVTRYMAPEAVLGGVAVESDWWSLGIIVLEILTKGVCFQGVNDQAFLIHSLAGSLSLPSDLDPDMHLLLRGLLVKERSQRWKWPEVKQWLEGNPPQAPSRVPSQQEIDVTAIRLGERIYTRVSDYCFAAANSDHWEEALQTFLRGELVSWADEIGTSSQQLALLRSLPTRDLDNEFRLAIALKILNSDMPLVVRGEIVSAGWLVENPLDGYRLLESEAPEILHKLDKESWGWLLVLKKRAEAIRKRAAYYKIKLNETDLRQYMLSTSKARLTVLWEEQRKILPDTSHRGLGAIAARRSLSDEDLVILLAAEKSLFRSVDEVIGETAELASGAKVKSFVARQARETLQAHNRREIFEQVSERIADFAHCGLARIDEWAGQFRHDKHLPLSQALLLLAIPQEQWKKPLKQAYISDLISFFEQKVALQIKRGPLARMTISKSSRKIDLMDFDTQRVRSANMLDQLIERSPVPITLDPTVFAEQQELEMRLRGLHQEAMLYKRDTGIDGLYLGFPFLLHQPMGSSVRPRIAPVLLWPIRLEVEVGTRGSFKLVFDHDREEVRFNPALEGFLGHEEIEKWREAADNALGHASNASDVIDSFGHLATPQKRVLGRLPGQQVRVEAAHAEMSSSAVLFHVSFMGQAVLEDLRHLKQTQPQGSALEVMLRLRQPREETGQKPEEPAEVEQYFTVPSDPSQRDAVLNVRHDAGIVIEGPPGTGKSQTIVNLVGDAIGRGKTLLLVCQKQAALDVVRKRLEAEGLGNRFVMVSDINRDRRAVIQSIRNQIDELFGQILGDDRIDSMRLQNGTRIETLERDLDCHHEAMHQVDPALGRSYREILGELVKLEEEAKPPVDCVSLREVVEGFDLQQLTTIEESCAPLARYWLKAAYEESALAVLQSFSWDEASTKAFERDFGHFVDIETARKQVADRAPQNYSINMLRDAELLRWIETARKACAPSSFLSLFNPVRYLARHRLRKLLAGLGEESSDKFMLHFLSVARLEKENRPERIEKRGESFQALQQLERWMTERWLQTAASKIENGDFIDAELVAISKARPTLPDYQYFRAKAQNLPSKFWKVFAALRKSEVQWLEIPESDLETEVRRTLNRETRLSWKARMEAQAPVLLLSETELTAKIKLLADSGNKMRSLNKEMLNLAIDRTQLGPRGKWEDITRLQGPRMIRLREFVDRGRDLGLFKMRPVWLMNPDTASRLLPQNRAMFDMVVFDEASQMPVEYALPTLFRGASVVISGDEKQLPPASFFSSQIEEEEDTEYGDFEPDEDATEEQIEAAEDAWNRREIKDCPDLLALGRAVLPNTMLEVHYRSRYRELISYSNAAFYSGRLNIPVQHPDEEILRIRPIEVVRVDGLYHDQTNGDEARKVVDLLAGIWQEPDRPSTGVVTFNRKQARLIEKQLEERAETDTVFQKAFSQELNRVEDGEDMGFFVKNVENVQGDERDAIIFSTTFGPNKLGRFRRNFGVLGQRGGERRLNVAISRAREKIWLVTSMPVSDISDMLYTDRAPDTPRDFLQGYLHYAEQLTNGSLRTARATLHQVQGRSATRQRAGEEAIDDGFRDVVLKEIRALGYEPELVLDGSVFGIDFAIRHPKTGLFGIGIECDSPRHRILKKARDREIWRPEMLSRSLSYVHRISSHGWYHERTLEKQKLAKAICTALV